MIDGIGQTNARPAGITDGYTVAQNEVPLAGTLSLGEYNASGLLTGYNTNVVIGSADDLASTLSVSMPVPADRSNTAYFDAAALDGSGLGGLNINVAGSIKVEAPLNFASGAQVQLIAPNVDVGADITARSGSLTVSNFVQAGQNPFALTTPAGTSQLTLEDGATIDLRGVWVNEVTDPYSAPGLAFLNGGDVTFNSTQNVALASGSAIDVSSGGAILANLKTQGGSGGNVTIEAGSLNTAVSSQPAATLTLASTIRAYGVNGGGTLTILSPGNVLIASDPVLAATVPATGTLALDPSFFTAGFSNYVVNGAGGVVVADNTVLAPVMPVYEFTPGSFAAASGSDPSSAMTLWVPPLFLANPINATLTQRGGASLTLASLTGSGFSTSGGAIEIGQGASVAVDPGQSITLDAFGQLTVLGDLTAHGGSITLTNSGNMSEASGVNFDSSGNGRDISIWVDAGAVLDVSGISVSADDVRGRSFGEATNGGAITINGGSSFVIVRPGAVLDADGAEVAIDLAAGEGVRAPSQPLTLASNGGSIALSSESGLYLDGDIHARSGGEGCCRRQPVGDAHHADLIPTACSPPTPYRPMCWCRAPSPWSRTSRAHCCRPESRPARMPLRFSSDRLSLALTRSRPAASIICL